VRPPTPMAHPKCLPNQANLRQLLVPANIF
jgi:hypothetical protein